MNQLFKGKFDTNVKIPSLFAHLHVLNLCDFLSFVEHKRILLTVLVTFLHAVAINYVIIDAIMYSMISNPYSFV